ncbi:hypothetical protein FH972_026378 [Carpinus fangiana]|uniref:Uncharacterized protein n=1 Tax=Carpinus fangiana TaxID=176857 RepID=A0A5N6L3R7_9ROSI|nr:hypothetical protein FH972_026378 [Carpinus fangiana]
MSLPHPSFMSHGQPQPGHPSQHIDAEFDILDWFPAYESCRKFFLDHAQHTYQSRALAAMINIQLPAQWKEPVGSSQPSTPRSPGHAQSRDAAGVSLHIFVRRLVVTGFDKDGVMHGLFGDDWHKGVGPIQQCERRNYLFTAKSVGWAAVKAHYDMRPDQCVPFLRPLQVDGPAELEGAEKGWSDWLYMQDWMLGSRAPSSDIDATDSSHQIALDVDAVVQ